MMRGSGYTMLAHVTVKLLPDIGVVPATMCTSKPADCRYRAVIFHAVKSSTAGSCQLWTDVSKSRFVVAADTNMRSVLDR